MKNFRKKFPKPAAPEANVDVSQRRLAKIVHDERGTASVRWEKAPEGYKRPVLAVDDPLIDRQSKVQGGIEVLHIKSEENFNPYERVPNSRKKKSAKRDLRKLSEYITMMRQLEERKRHGGDEEED